MGQTIWGRSSQNSSRKKNHGSKSICQCFLEVECCNQLRLTAFAISSQISCWELAKRNINEAKIEGRRYLPPNKNTVPQKVLSIPPSRAEKSGLSKKRKKSSPTSKKLNRPTTPHHEKHTDVPRELFLPIFKKHGGLPFG